MVHNLCSNYGWSFDQAIKMTLPQIIMLNHFAWVQQERADRKYAHKQEVDGDDLRFANPIAVNGKRVKELSDEEMTNYLTSFGDIG